MQIVLRGVSVQGRREPMLVETELRWSTGECLLVAGEPGQGHTALALVATGRLRPTQGEVAVLDDGPATDEADAQLLSERTAELRRVSAVVDVPGVSDPDDALTVADVAAEGLALAGRRSLPSDVTQWLTAHSLHAVRRRRVDSLGGTVRTTLLASLAAEDPDVRFLVLTLPDRHGGDPGGWWGIARGFAERGLGVLVQCTRGSARMLGADVPPLAHVHEPPYVALREQCAPQRPEHAAEPPASAAVRQDAGGTEAAREEPREPALAEAAEGPAAEPEPASPDAEVEPRPEPAGSFAGQTPPGGPVEKAPEPAEGPATVAADVDEPEDQQ